MQLDSNVYNALNKIASKTKMDCWFYIKSDESGDHFIDLENNCTEMTPYSAMCQLQDGIESGCDYGLTDDERAAVEEYISVATAREIKVRQISADICDLFEDLLDRFYITIPDENREGDETEARLYGGVYSDLEDAVTQIVAQTIKQVKANPNVSVNVEEY